ncbi:MAG: isoleucine--tRNA ligase [Candidatus Puniceispirillaceae bacterium]
MDYKQTVFLPKTDFPMRGGLPKKEPEIMAHWKKLDLYKRLRAERADAPKFVLHDGPPYANGQLHIGHALNKILKDVINRSQSMLGKNANYVPGWDCHGLPIEWKIEEQYRKKGKDKDEVPISEFRQECRDFAAHWLQVQSEEFQRLGILGDWENPYTTMKFEAESIIAAEMGKFLMNGSLYRGAKPVMWSPVEKTALAEAEVEYSDHKSVTIFARFTLKQSPVAGLEGAHLIIWTTTPWTMPGNRAMACGADIDYSAVKVTEIADGALARIGDVICLADALRENVFAQTGILAAETVAQFKGSEMAGAVAAHPLASEGYDHDVPVLLADYVTTEQGTGFVHIAPGHGPEDFELAHLKHGIEVPDTVGEDGVLAEHLPLFGGMHVLRDNARIAEIMAEKGGLIGIGSLTHSYPHSWRSHAPVIYRNAAQWFVSMGDKKTDGKGLRETALDALKVTAFYPASGQNRLTAMIANRPDWCLSRQRAWGVPIPVFYNKKTGEPLRDQAVVDRIVAAFAADGCDVWFTKPASEFLGPDYDEQDYVQVRDIADVWFDSGSTHAFVLEARADLQSPADLYLEGSDQHRGWFHSSLLESCGTRGHAPYKGVLTHGFVLDEQGRKMSKSLGNVIAPQKVIEQNGADILRLWVVSSDYYDDLRIGPEIIKRQSDHYRRIRNTLRYLLGAGEGYDVASEGLAPEQMPELDRWVLHRLTELDKLVREKTEQYDFHAIFTQIHDFCNGDLSAFYFDIRKDTLYCDSPASIERRACRTVMDETLKCLISWIAPILCFTADEAWMAYRGDAEDSIHLHEYASTDAKWEDQALGQKWDAIRKVRSEITTALEAARNEGLIGGSLSADIRVHVSAETGALLEGLDLASLCITSSAELITGSVTETRIEVARATGGKCARCWKQFPQIPATSEGEICSRCADVVSTQDVA